MLTPQEIQETGFRRAVIGGYISEDVDEFLELVVEDYEELYTENAVLKRKIKMLVDKIEEHRASEDSVRSVLANAQKNSEDMYRETREKCRRLTRETDEKAKKTIADMKAKVAIEERRLASLCTNVEQFVAAVQKVIDKQNDNMKELTNAAATVRATIPTGQTEQKPTDKASEKTSQSKDKPSATTKKTNGFDEDVENMTVDEINKVVAMALGEDIK